MRNLMRLWKTIRWYVLAKERKQKVSIVDEMREFNKLFKKKQLL